MVYGFDIFSAGTFFSKFGVIVGIPINFTYVDVGATDKHTIRVRFNIITNKDLILLYLHLYLLD